MYCIGLDVHAKATNFAIKDDYGRTVRRFVVKGPQQEVVAQVKELQKELGALRLCFEASTSAGWLLDHLQGPGRQVQVAHPGQVRLIFRAKRKNDRIDAEKLAFLTYMNQVPLAHIPSPQRRQWRALIEYRRSLIEKRGSVKNALRAILRSQVIRPPCRLWTQRGLEWLSKVELGFAHGLQRDQLREELQQIQRKLLPVEKKLQETAAQEPGVKLLMTIPGVGIRTAEAVMAYVDDPRRFRRNKSVGCYFGLVPCEDTSQKVRFGHITKEGPSTVRKYLTEASWQAIRRDPTLKAYYERVRREDPHRSKIALIATAHHLVRVMLAMLVWGEEWNPAYQTRPGAQKPLPTAA
jgi:transposase